MPDKYKSWNGIVMTEDIWIDKAMRFEREVRNQKFGEKRVKSVGKDAPEQT
jgi:hypothetical protein